MLLLRTSNLTKKIKLVENGKQKNKKSHMDERE